MAVLVSRGRGDRQGPDIVDELLTTEAGQIERGRGEINYSCSPRTIEQAQIVKRGFVPTGSLVEVVEALGIWRGKSTYFSRTRSIDDSGERFTVDCNLNIERER